MVEYAPLDEFQSNVALSAIVPVLSAQWFLLNVPQPSQGSEPLVHQLSSLWAPTLFEPSSKPQAVLSALLTYEKRNGEEGVEAEFRELAKKWRVDRPATSSTTAIVTHPSYQKIISLGRPVIPLILRELDREVDHWFWALAVITDENPVREESRGRMSEMADAWLAWGRAKGYVK